MAVSRPGLALPGGADELPELVDHGLHLVDLDQVLVVAAVELRERAVVLRHRGLRHTGGVTGAPRQTYTIPPAHSRNARERHSGETAARSGDRPASGASAGDNDNTTSRDL